MADNNANSQKCVGTKVHPSASSGVKPPGAKEPDAFARLAQAVDGALEHLNHPKAEKRSAPLEPVSLSSLASHSPSASRGTQAPCPERSRTGQPVQDDPSRGAPCGSGLEPRQNTRPMGASSRACPERSRRERLEGRSSSSTPLRASRSRPATVSQAKNYLRSTRPPKFLDPRRSLERHSRKCAICHHSEREMIEELFVHWHSPRSIVNFLEDYDNVNWVSIYRHAYALGLDAVRRRNLGFVFECILDNAADATPTAAGVAAAARALACVTEDGRWVEPEKRITMTTVVRHEDPSATTSTEQEEPDVALSASSRACPERSRRERSEGRGSSSTSLRASHGRAATEESVCVSSSSLPEAAVQNSASSALSVHGSRDTGHGSRAIRSGTREIRLPLNSHKTKHKQISNR